MKTGILIIARLGSTRLKRKHLLDLRGEPIFSILLERIKKEFFKEICERTLSLIICTADEPENRAFEQFKDEAVNIFYGSNENIPLRQWQAAEKHRFDAIVSIDGDDILCSPRGMRKVYKTLQSSTPYVKTSGLPFGMNSMGYTSSFLKESLQNHFSQVLETGWGKIFDEKKAITLSLPIDLHGAELRFTLDYDEDYQFFQAIAENYKGNLLEASDSEIVNCVLSHTLQTITQPILQEYWDNFNYYKNQEGAGQLKMKMTGQNLWKKAKKIIPGGNQLLSKRAERFLPGLWPAYYSKAKGCEVWDLDGNHYYDFAQMGVGSCVLGYADEEVNHAVMQAITNGAMATLNCHEEVELAERLLSLHPWAQMARFSRTGGEACAVAIRIARAASGRGKVAFCGYHGWHDWYLAANLGNQSNLDGQLLPGLDPLGVPRELAQTALPFNYNKLEELEALVTKFSNEIGVIIMEPCRGQAPAPGFLEGVRKLANKIGAVLVFDEVTSGFRMNMGGIHLTYNVEPDVAIFGKALGNGFPISAIIGRKSVMNAAQGSFISSTFWTERIGFTAALATLKKMEERKVPEALIHYGESINRGWNTLAKKCDLQIHISGIPPLTHLSFLGNKGLAAQTLYTQEMLAKGYLLGASVYPTYAYSNEIIARFIKDSESAFESIKNALNSGHIEKHLKGDVIQTAFKRLT